MTTNATTTMMAARPPLLRLKELDEPPEAPASVSTPLLEPAMPELYSEEVCVAVGAAVVVMFSTRVENVLL